MKLNLIVSGIEEKKIEDCKALISSFFKDQMKIDKEIAIATAHRIGPIDKNNRSIVVKLIDGRDKGTIYKHAKNLKDTKYYVNDQLPDKQTEEHRKKKQKVQINKTLVDAQQQNIEWKKGELVVDGNVYRNKVVEPANAEILEMTTSQINQLFQIRLTQGQEIKKNGSTFLGFAAKVHSLQDVVKAYKQLRYRFMDSTHIMCAYRIMDPDVAHMQDSLDNGEYGAGRRLLQQLIDESVKNTATFVVRHHRGQNIGPIRFSIITDAAKSAIDAIPADIEKLLGNSIPNPAPGFSFFNNHEERLSRGGLTRRRTRGVSQAARQLNYGQGIKERPKTPTSKNKTNLSQRKQAEDVHV